MEDNSTATRPSCFAHRHMTGAQYALYETARSKSIKSRVYIFSSRRAANEFQKMSKDTALRAAKALELKGWFEPLTPVKTSTGEARYKPLSHKEWVAKNTDKSCRSNDEPSPEQPTRKRKNVSHIATDGVANSDSVKDNTCRKLRGRVSQIKGWGVANRDGGVANKGLGVANYEEALPVTSPNDRDLASQSAPLTSVNLCKITSANTNLCLTSGPPGSEFADVNSSIRQDPSAPAGVSSAPNVAVQRTPVPGKYPVPPRGVSLWVNTERNQYYDSGSNAPVSLTEALRRFEEASQ